MYSGLAHFILTSQKGISEPGWAGRNLNDTERELTLSQEDCFLDGFWGWTNDYDANSIVVAGRQPVLS